MPSIYDVSSPVIQLDGLMEEDYRLSGQWTNKEQTSSIIYDHLALTLELVIRVILLGGISVLGILANVINVVVFVRQGFSDTINISLLGLALSDLGSLLGLAVLSICYNPLFAQSGIPVNVKQIQYIIAGWPHVCFARISCAITAFITLERCLCIALPHKVKSLITPFRTRLIISAIFLIILASVAPVYFVTRFTFVFDERSNSSLLSFVYTDNGRDIESLSFSFNVFILLASVVVVAMCTATLIQNLLQKSKWRKSMASVDDSFATRDRRVVKMVLFVAITFIACYLPFAIGLTLRFFLPEFGILGLHKNMFSVVFGFLFVLEAVNSSVNIFIYYNMSSKFKAEVRRLFKCPKQEQGKGGEANP